MYACVRDMASVLSGTVDAFMDFWCVYLFGYCQQVIPPPDTQSTTDFASKM